MKILIFCLLTITNLAAEDCNSSDNNKYYFFSGDVYVVGFFDAHYGENCSEPNALPLQQMYDVAAIVRMLNKIKYVPGISIGLSLYDTCGSKEIAVKSFISSLVDADCNFTYNLGVLSTNSAATMIKNLTTVKSIPVFTLDYAPDLNILLEISVELLSRLDYNNVDLAVFPHTELQNNFNNFTVAKNICVKESMTYSEYEGLCPGNDLIVVLAVTSSELSFLLKLEMDCLSTFVIIILENGIDLSTITEHILLRDVYLVIPSNIWPEFDIAVQDDFESIVSVIEGNLHHSNVTMNLIRTASTVISVVDHFKHKILTECGNTTLGLCSNLTHFKTCDETLIAEGEYNVSELLGVDNDNILHYLIWKIGINSAESFGKVKIVEDQVLIEFAHDAVHHSVSVCELNVENCKNCSNFAYFNDMSYKIVNKMDTSAVNLRPNGWVNSILTICIIGVISCVCVLVFIIVRIYKEDILEGNPCSSFLLITATILMYLAVIPFCFEVSEQKTLCALKLFGSSFCYCFIFSVILSRVLMILTCDYNGSFMSHINGYLQSFLCFFMFAVQVALITEFWIFQWILSDVNYCSKFMNNNLFLSYMMYDTFLLLLIAIIVPFVAKSRRNYREGLSFSVATACFILIWIAWSFGYFAASPEWKDFCVAAGLTGTASVVVVSIFIPRTYLIVTGIVRDRINSAIPNTASNIVDMNYRSTQALYDSVQKQQKGEQNMAYYDDPHGSSSNSSRIDVDVRKEFVDSTQSVENNYESCDVPNHRQKITKF